MNKLNRSAQIFGVFVISLLLVIKISFLISYFHNFSFLTYDEIGRRDMIIGLKNTHLSLLHFIKYSDHIWLPIYFYFYAFFLLIFNSPWYTIQSASEFLSFLTLIFAFLLGRQLYSNTAGIIACFILVVSTDFNLISISAYSTILSAFGFVAFAYFLSVWLENKKSINLLFSSMGLLFYIGSRYESWLLVALLWAIWAITSFKDKRFRISEILYISIPPLFCILWMIRCKILFHDYFRFVTSNLYDQFPRKDLYFPSYYLSMVDFYFTGFWIFLGLFVSSFPYVVKKIKNPNGFIYLTLLIILLGTSIIRAKGQIWNWYPQGAYIPLLVLLSILVAVSFAVFFNEATKFYKALMIVLLIVLGVINLNSVYESRFGIPLETAEGNSNTIKFLDEKIKESKKINVVVFGDYGLKRYIEMTYNNSPSISVKSSENYNDIQNQNNDYIIGKSQNVSFQNYMKSNKDNFYEITTYHSYKSFYPISIFAPIKQIENNSNLSRDSFNYKVEKKGNVYQLQCVFPYTNGTPDKIYFYYNYNSRTTNYDLTNYIEKVARINKTHLSYIFTIPQNIPNGPYQLFIVKGNNNVNNLMVTFDIVDQSNKKIKSDDILGPYNIYLKTVELWANSSAYIGFRPEGKINTFSVAASGESISTKTWSKLDIYINGVFIKTVHLNSLDFLQNKIKYDFKPNEYYIIELRGNTGNGGTKVSIKSAHFSYSIF